MSQEKNESKPGLFSAYVGVVRASLFGKVDPDHEFTFHNRQVLHENSPPEVQAVNQYLDKNGVDLDPAHVPHFEQGTAIKTTTTESLAERATQRLNNISNENNIANSFAEEAARERAKGDNTHAKTELYARVGFWAHSTLKVVEAATNPYTHYYESDLFLGVPYNYPLQEEKQNNTEITPAKR